MDSIRKIEEPVSVEEQWSRSPERCWTAMPATLNNEPCVKGLYKAALYQQAVAKLKHEELEQAYKSWRMDRALIADREAELAEAGLKYVSLFGELQNAMEEIARLKSALLNIEAATTDTYASAYARRALTQPTE